MGGVVAIFERPGTPVDPDALARATESTRTRAADRRGTWHAGHVGLGSVMYDTTPEAEFERLPLEAGPYVLVSDARIDNRSDLIPRLRNALRGLGLSSAARPVTDADLVLAAYAEWGRGCPGRLVGDFAFAVWDSARGVLFLARDHFGVRPLYVHEGGPRVVAGTEPATLFAAGVPKRVDREAFKGLLATGGVLSADRTVFAGVRLLPNGHAAEVSERGVHEWAYHRLSPSPTPDDQEEALEGFRTLFRKAVEARTRGGARVGVQLSGGLDSSAVACVARDKASQRGEGPLPAFTLRFEASPVSDEREYSEAVFATGGFDRVVVQADAPSPLGNLGEIYPLLGDGPAAGAHHWIWEMYRAASDRGLRVMLDGVDGDVVVDHGSLRLYELARAGDWERFFYEAQLLGRRFGADPRSRQVRNVEFSFSEGPRHLFAVHGLRALDEAAAGSRVEFARVLAGAVRHGGARPGAVLRRVWRRLLMPRALLRRVRPDSVRQAPSLRENQLETLSNPRIAWSLALSSHAGAAFGLEVAHPFFDVRLVEYCLGLSSEHSLQDGVTRNVLRRGVDDTVPREVVERTAKATMAPAFDRALLVTDRPLLYRAAAIAAALPQGLRSEATDDFPDEVRRLTAAYDAGSEVAGTRIASLATRASALLWADVLDLVPAVAPHPERDFPDAPPDKMHSGDAPKATASPIDPSEQIE